MTMEEHQQREKEIVQGGTKWPGSVRKGAFWCECEPPHQARYFTTRNGPNKGKRFWTCAKAREDPEHCSFWIWVDDEAEAKEWLKIFGPGEVPETPSKAALPSRSPDTPWTLAKRKPLSRGVLDENENGGPSKRKGDDGQVFDGDEEVGESPSRKAVKTDDLTTPGGQTFLDRLKEAALPLTPDTLDKGKEKVVEDAHIQGATTTRNVKPSKCDIQHTHTGHETLDLATRVLKLLREENHELKGSTELLIRHEIEGEMDLNATKVKSCVRAISRMSEKIDELETQISDWIGVESVDETI